MSNSFQDSEVLSPGPGQGVRHDHKNAPGFAQTFGLHPSVVFLTVTADTMLFGAEVATAGVGWVMSVPVAVVLACITYLAQKKWYGDDHEEALLKALAVGVLTAIPTSLPGLLTIPAGILGFLRNKTK